MSKSQIVSLVLCIALLAGMVAYYFIFIGNKPFDGEPSGPDVSTAVSNSFDEASSSSQTQTDGVTSNESTVDLGGVVISSMPANSSSNQGAGDSESSSETSQSSNITSTAPDTSLTYKQYLLMSPTEQQSYYESFPSLEDFIVWHTAAKSAYDAEMNSGVVSGSGDGFDIGDIINGNQ
ncbi:MAG: hypothetical protein E7525_06600 [Ruminococcaceae bacterium]|nr:hypothetical protein [Oscillospiraceae bacterium]